MKEEKTKGTLSFFRNFENAIMLKNEKREKKKKLKEHSNCVFQFQKQKNTIQEWEKRKRN